MHVLFRLAYSVAVAIFFILFVIFGSRTFYDEPDYPRYPRGPGQPGVISLYCDDRDCYYNDQILTPEIEDNLSPTQQAYIADQREYQEDLRNFEDRRDDYHRNVFIIAGFLGVLAIGAGIVLYREVEALPLGLVLGGIGSVLYGWAESSTGDGDVTEAYPFVVAAIGLVILLGGGYWTFGKAKKPEEPAG